MSEAITERSWGWREEWGAEGHPQGVDVSRPLEIAGVVGDRFSFTNASLLLRSLLTEADAGHTEFTDEVYQNESRYPGGEWKPAEDTYTDAVSAAPGISPPAGGL